MDRTPVDEYLDGVSPAIRPTLDHLRAVIRDELGDCDEVSSYGMPGFRLRPDNPFGAAPRVVCGFAATKAGASFYPHSGSVLDGFEAELAGWSRTKSAVHLTAQRPLPDDLVRRIVRAKIEVLRSL